MKPDVPHDIRDGVTGQRHPYPSKAAAMQVADSMNRYGLTTRPDLPRSAPENRTQRYLVWPKGEGPE